MASTYPSPASIKTPNVGNAASVAIAPQNLSRDSLYIFNPGPNVLWVCPSVSSDQSPLPAAVAGVGSLPLQPMQGFFLDGFTGSVNAIAVAGAVNVITVWENYQPTKFGLTLFSAFPFPSQGQIPGTTTNDNAAAGNVGEFISSLVGSGSAIPLTNTVFSNVTSISLTPGDWDVTATVAFLPGATTSIIYCVGGISSVSGTTQGIATYALLPFSVSGTVVIPSAFTVICPPVRQSLAVTTTIFMVAQSNFTVSTMSAYGFLRARRVR